MWIKKHKSTRNSRHKRNGTKHQKSTSTSTGLIVYRQGESIITAMKKSYEKISIEFDPQYRNSHSRQRMWRDLSAGKTLICSTTYWFPYKENINDTQHGALGRRNLLWPIESLHKGQVMQKVFRCCVRPHCEGPVGFRSWEASDRFKKNP